NIEETHSYVLRILQFQIPERDFGRINFNLHPSASSLKLGIPRSELIHILANIYSNAVHNFLEHGVEQPVVEISGLKKSDRHASVFIKDNGTGLTVEAYEALTDFNFWTRENNLRNRGLGLRLVRRLVEQRGGTLSVIANGAD